MAVVERVVVEVASRQREANWSRHQAVGKTLLPDTRWASPPYVVGQHTFSYRGPPSQLSNRDAYGEVFVPVAIEVADRRSPDHDGVVRGFRKPIQSYGQV